MSTKCLNCQKRTFIHLWAEYFLWSGTKRINCVRVVQFQSCSVSLRIDDEMCSLSWSGWWFRNTSKNMCSTPESGRWRRPKRWSPLIWLTWYWGDESRLGFNKKNFDSRLFCRTWNLTSNSLTDLTPDWVLLNQNSTREFNWTRLQWPEL